MNNDGDNNNNNNINKDLKDTKQQLKREPCHLPKHDSKMKSIQCPTCAPHL